MRDRAVVAFVEILDDYFPVRGNFVDVAPKHPHLREIDPRALENRWQVAQNVAHWGGGRGRVDENQRPPHLDRKRRERQRVLRELSLLILARRGAERAVQVVGPSVVVTLQGLAIARAFKDDLTPAMTAYVGKRANRTTGISHDHDRQI